MCPTGVICGRLRMLVYVTGFIPISPASQTLQVPCHSSIPPAFQCNSCALTLCSPSHRCPWVAVQIPAFAATAEGINAMRFVAAKAHRVSGAAPLRDDGEEEGEGKGVNGDMHCDTQLSRVARESETMGGVRMWGGWGSKIKRAADLDSGRA